MYRTLLATLIFLLFITVSYCQKVLVNVYMVPKTAKPKSDTIYYDTSRLLTWKDFQGVPDNHHFGGAVTASGYAFNADIQTDQKAIYLNIGVFVYFDRKSSWKKPGISTEYHLLHEQHHFDITRLSAENFIISVARSKFTKDNYNQLLNTLFDRSYAACDQLQEEYDRETNHSINPVAQGRWNNKITAMVRKL